MAQIGLAIPAKHHPIRVKQPGFRDLVRVRPACRPVGFDFPGFTGAMDRQRHGGGESQHPTRSGHPRPARKDVRGIGVEFEPPPEKQRRRVDRPVMEQHEPGPTEFRLEAQFPGRPLGRGPPGQDDNGQDHRDLSPLNFGSRHFRFLLAQEQVGRPFSVPQGLFPRRRIPAHGREKILVRCGPDRHHIERRSRESNDNRVLWLDGCCGQR